MVNSTDSVKSLSQLWRSASHVAETRGSRISSAQSWGFENTFHVRNDLLREWPAQSGLFFSTVAGTNAVKAALHANSARFAPYGGSGAGMRIFPQLTYGAGHLRKAVLRYADFHRRKLLLHHSSFTGPDVRCFTSSLSSAICAHPSLAKSAYSCSTKCLYSTVSVLPCCKAIFEISIQNKQSSLALPYILTLRTFSSEPPVTKHSSLMKQSTEGLTSLADHYKTAVSLQIETFWRRNMLIVVGAVGVLSCYLLWRIMYGVASIFVTFSEKMAKIGLLAMAASTVAFAAIILRNRYTINPDKVYRIIMRSLNTSSKALEVLGAPLIGSDLRAYVMSGGGLRLKNFKPTFSRKRCFIMFPVQGSERNGLVSAEVKKTKGKYDFKLLAIDVAALGSEQQMFIIGDERGYKVGGGLMSQLRTPILKAMAAQEEFEAQDEREAEEEERAQVASRQLELEEAQKNDELKRLDV